jgi:hypothetical protein
MYFSPDEAKKSFIHPLEDQILIVLNKLLSLKEITFYVRC